MKKTALAIVFSLLPLTAFAQTRDAKLANLVPAGYRIVEEIKGDLNKDGLNDYVLIIKGPKTDDDCRKEGEDCSHRGIIVAFNRGDRYELALENRDCFASEDRNGGVYYPPDLSVSVKKGNVYIRYEHGRYGYWAYTFRYQNSDFELIGYDETGGSAGSIDKILSINFLTKKMLTKRNIDEDKPTFEETWKKVTLQEPIKLRKITDFSEFYIMNHIKIN